MAGIVDLRRLFPILQAFSLRMAKFGRQAFSAIHYRSGSFWSVILGFCLRKTWSRKQDDTSPLSLPQKIESNPPWVHSYGIKLVEGNLGPYLQESSIPAYTTVQSGGVISLDSASLSSYPSPALINEAPYVFNDTISAGASDNPATADSSTAVIAEQSYSAKIATRGHDLDVQEVKVASLANIRIKPVMPEGTQRYDRRSTVSANATTITIESLSLDFDEQFLPPGWVKYAHPEGARYFYNQKKKVYTDADILDSRILECITDNLVQIECFLVENDISLPETSILVIDSYYQEDGSIQSTYYYLDTTLRVIFFLDVYHAEDLLTWDEIPGIKSKTHLRHELEAQYWFHVSLYPHTLELSLPLVCELRDTVLHFIGDTMTSAVATSPYTSEELQRILKVANALEKNINHHNVGAVSLVSRFMYIFCHTRFYNFHGEPQARLERDHSVYGCVSGQKTWLIKISSYLLFSVPELHLQNLQKLQVDRILYKYDWERTMETIKEEWEKLTLLGTCLFIALGANSPKLYGASGQVMAYLSTFCGSGTVILGIVLLQQNRESNRMNAQTVQKFLAKNNSTSFGLEPLAILYSLPYGLLMWGLLLFLAAICAGCIQSPNRLTPIVVGPICATFGMIVFWLSPYWPSKRPGDTEPRPVSETKELQDSSTGEINTKPKPFWRLSNLLNIPQGSRDSVKTAV